MSTASVVDTPSETTEIEVALTRVIAQISDIREQMRDDDAAIARVKAENMVLKAETQTLRDETRAIIARLQTAA